MENIQTNGEVKKKNHLLRKKKLDILFSYGFLLPSILTALVFYIYVNLSSFTLAFQRNDEFVGLENFRLLLDEIKTPGSTLSVSIRNTFVFFAKDIVMFFWGIIIAYFFYKKVRGTNLIRILWTLPGLVTGMVYVIMFSTLVEPEGVIEEVIRWVNPDFTMPQLLGRSDTATWTILAYTVWMGWGVNMLYLGGTFASIPLEVLESARLDGVGPWRELVQIILPMVMPTICTLFLLLVLGLPNAGGPVLLFTEGDYDTSTVGYWMFTLVYNTGKNQYSTASAAGMVITAIMLPIAWAVRRISNKLEDIL